MQFPLHHVVETQFTTRNVLLQFPLMCYPLVTLCHEQIHNFVTKIDKNIFSSPKYFMSTQRKKCTDLRFPPRFEGDLKSTTPLFSCVYQLLWKKFITSLTLSDQRRHSPNFAKDDRSNIVPNIKVNLFLYFYISILYFYIHTPNI